jgi:uncharacterized protein YkwD
MNQVDQFLFDQTNAYRAEGGLGPIVCDSQANALSTEWSKGQCDAYAAHTVSAFKRSTYVSMSGMCDPETSPNKQWILNLLCPS